MKRKRILACACVLLAGILLYGGQTVFAAFNDNGNGTVSDSVTGLMWQQSDDGTTRTWEEALNYCEDLSLGGYSDWRLPNVRELESIVDWDSYDPAIDTAYFPNCRSSFYWSGSTGAGSDGAWGVPFSSGGVYYYYKTNNDAYVRCVRAGPSGSFDYSIIATAGTGGTISPSGTVTVTSGENATFTITANSGYQISDVKVDGTSQGAIGTYTFSNVTQNHTISATFTRVIPTIPTVTTGLAILITSDTVTLRGKVNPNGSSTEAYFEYGTTTSYESSTSFEDIGAGTSSVTVSATISDLIPDTTYHYRLTATNIDGTSSGADMTFYTAIIYVSSSDGTCGGNTPCYTTIQEAADAADSGSIIKIAEGTYDEDLTLDSFNNLTLRGGWDSTFTTQSSYTTVNSITISNGTIAVDKLVIQ